MTPPFKALRFALEDACHEAGLDNAATDRVWAAICGPIRREEEHVEQERRRTSWLRFDEEAAA